MALLCAVLVILTCASCASLSRQPASNRPRTNEPPYPVILGASEERRDKALGVWATLTSEQGVATKSAPAPELQPVTATLRALPDVSALAATPLRLPKVGGDIEGRGQTEEELRESLRRFIADAAPLLGVEPANLSLVEQKDNPDETKRARYQQKPFLFPLRAGYGIVEIVFTPDRRIVSLSSAAIPDTERIERAFANFRPQLLSPKDASARLNNRAVTYKDASGAEQTLTLGATDEMTVREIVVYPIRRANDPSTLALHLAWEVAVSRGSTPMLIYVDAVHGETLAVVRSELVEATPSTQE